jgi:hypothetical protein
MPLSPGSDRETVSRNISEMVHAGHPQEQAVAAALRNARGDCGDEIAYKSGLVSDSEDGMGYAGHKAYHIGKTHSPLKEAEDAYEKARKDDAARADVGAGPRHAAGRMAFLEKVRRRAREVQTDAVTAPPDASPLEQAEFGLEQQRRQREQDSYDAAVAAHLDDECDALDKRIADLMVRAGAQDTQMQTQQQMLNAAVGGGKAI